MKASCTKVICAMSLSLLLVSNTQAIDLLSASDFIIDININPGQSFSDYPGGESPLEAGDNLTGTKYLNFAGPETGLIVTPRIGATTIQSLVLTTGNDAEERDPASYAVYGSNVPVAEVDRGTPVEANWTLISEGSVALPSARQAIGPTLSFSSNTQAYSSYRVEFPTLKNNETVMQVAEIDLFTSNDGTGSSVWDNFDTPISFQRPQLTSNHPGNEGPENLLDGIGVVSNPQSFYPPGEGPDKAIDGTPDKYLNAGAKNSGFIVTPAASSSAVQSIQFTSSNDFAERDPSSYEIYGTFEPISSTDNSFGTSENWVLIQSGDAMVSDTRGIAGGVIPVTNTQAYNSYKVLFPTLKNDGDPFFALGDASFFASNDGTGTDLLIPSDQIIAIDGDFTLGEESKYLNQGGANSGFIVTPTSGSSIVDSFTISTADDAAERDPGSWELYGTNEAIASADGSQGDGESWTLIDSGTFDDTEVTPARTTEGAVVSITNSDAYTSYRMIFPTLRDGMATDLLQLAGIQFFGDLASGGSGDLNNDGFVDGADFLQFQRGFGSLYDATDLANFRSDYGTAGAQASAVVVPEPTSALLMVLAMGMSFGVHRRGARGRASRR